MENLIVVGNVRKLSFWKREPDALVEFAILGRTVKIVANEEAAAIDVLAKNLALLLGQAPFARLHGIEKRIVKYFVMPSSRIDALLHGAGIDPRPAAAALRRKCRSARG